jgi:hypothetical protein
MRIRENGAGPAPYIHSFSLITASTQINCRRFPDLSSPEIFCSWANIISPGHDEPEAGVQGEIPEGTTRGKCRRRRTQSQAPHPESVGSWLAPSTTIIRWVYQSHKVCNGGIGLNVEVHEVCRAISVWGTSRSRDLRPLEEEQHCSDLYLVECSHRLWMSKAEPVKQNLILFTSRDVLSVDYVVYVCTILRLYAMASLLVFK